MNNFKVNQPMIPADYGEEESILSLYDKDSADKNFFDAVDNELIRLSGSKLLIYKYYESSEFDPVYVESRNKTLATEPISVFGHYDPRSIEESLGQFGIEIKNDQIFTFNKSYIVRRLGRPLIPGDVIESIFQKIKFKVFEVQETSFESYGIYHLQCHAKILREESSEDGIDTSKTLDNLEGRINDNGIS